MSGWLETTLFYFLAVLALIGATQAVRRRNLFHSLLFFGLFLLSVAGLFLLLQAEALALIQILIYIGGVATLFIFTLMLIPRTEEKPGKVASPFLVAILFFILLIYLFKEATFYFYIKETGVSFDKLATILLKNYLIPFEIIGLLLLTAFLAAYYIARRGEGS